MNIGILGMYMYLPIFALIVGLGFVFFSGDVFRYECQDPAYWGTPECEPPICKAAGLCTEDLIQFDTTTIEEKVAEDVVATDNMAVVDAVIEDTPVITDPIDQLNACEGSSNVQ